MHSSLLVNHIQKLVHAVPGMYEQCGVILYELKNVSFEYNLFYNKLKNASCEYDRLNVRNSTLQAAWYIRSVFHL